MKTTKNITVIGYRLWVIVLVLAMFSGVAQATAPAYKNTYKPMYQQVGAIQTTATAPTVGFKSTSAYSGQLNQDAQQSMLNADGTVNAEAYGVGAYRPGIRKGGSGSSVNPGTPDDEEEEEGEQQPIGDGLWILLFLVFAYAIYNKVFRKPEQPQKQ